MRDVARSAGVSLKTVSRVVNGETTVAPDLVARVRAAVESLNYRPHMGASMLRRNDRRTGTIGLLLPDVSSPFSAAVHRAVEDEARRRGVQLLAGSLDEDPARERELARAFVHRQAEGLIVTPAAADQSHLTAVGAVPIVFVDRPAEGFAGDSVLSTNEAGAVIAVRHLLAHGHRRIAYLGHQVRVATARRRFQGYLDALADVELEPFGAHDLVTVGAADHATGTMLRGPDPPTAIFASRSLITVGAIRALRRLGRQHDVALVGFDDFPLADLLDPGVTVIAQDPVRIGRTAARALFERIDGADGPEREFRIPATLITRGSGELSRGSD
jgi:LacI family transcriptional regulator